MLEEYKHLYHLCKFNVLPVLPFDRPFVQQSSSYRSPVPKRGHTQACRCQAVTTVRELFSSQFPSSPKFRSMKSVSFAMRRAEKAGDFQAPQPLCEEDSLVVDAAVLRLPGILSLSGIMLPVPVQGKNEQSIQQILTCWKHTSTCQSCQLILHTCSKAVHIDHQSRRRGTHAGVSQ